MLIQSGRAAGSHCFCVGLSVPEDGYLRVLHKGNLHNQQKPFCQHFCVCVCVRTCSYLLLRQSPWMMLRLVPVGCFFVWLLVQQYKLHLMCFLDNQDDIFQVLTFSQLFLQSKICRSMMNRNVAEFTHSNALAI